MLKVLVVDDDSPIRRWLEYCVSQLEGFVLAGSAATGAQGLELYRRELPDIVVTDIEMPGMSGLEMVQQIQAIRPAHVIILTSHDNFSYARQALQSGTAEYILKTEISLQSMTALLCKAARTIQTQQGAGAAPMGQSAQLLVRQLAMVGSPAPLTAQSLRRQGITLDDGPLAAGDLWSRNGQGLPGAQRLLVDSGLLQNLHFVPLGYQHLLLIGNLKRPTALDELAALCARPGGIPGCVLGLSEPKTGLTLLPEALHEAQARCQLHFYEPRRRVFLHDRFGPELLRRAETTRMNFSKALFTQNYPQATAIKDALLRRIAAERPTDLDAVKTLCASLCTILLHFSTDQPEELDHLVEQTEQAVREAQTMDALQQAVEQVFAPFQQTVMKDTAYSPAIRDAIAYMEEHYREKITLGMVAAEVNFNPEYFSRMFTRETGMNFIAFLNSLRMKQAVELLEHTDKKVYEIAEEAGYSSLSYFSTAFKKSFGQTPAEYQALKRSKS